MKKPIRIPQLTIVLLATFATLATLPAASLNWSAAPTSNAWGTNSNWSPVQVPVSSDALFFGTSTITSLDNNTTANNTYDLTFNAGASAFTISGNNMRLANGIVNNSSNLQTLALNVNTSNRSFTTSAGGGDLLFSGNLTAGSTTVTGAGVTTFSGNNSGNLAALTVNTSSTLRVGTAQNFLGGATFRLSAGGTLDLRNDSSTNFARTISFHDTGTRTINVNRAVGGSGSNGTMTMGNVTGETNSDRGLTITGGNGYGLTIDNYNSTLPLGGGARLISFTNNAPGTFTIGGNISVSTTLANSHTLEFAGTGNSVVTGNIAITPDASNGNFAVTKNGASTMTSNGTSNHKLATNVNAGSLIVNGNWSAATGNVIVAAGAALGGTGTLGGSTTIGGSLRPGNSIGTLTVNNTVTWTGTTANDWVFELGTSAVSLASAASGGSTQDMLSINGGDFAKGAGSEWQFSFATTGQNGWYKLVDWTGTTGFLATDFAAPTGLAGGRTGTFEIDGSALYLTVVPEPASMGLLMAGLCGLLLAQRYRRTRLMPTT